MSITGSITWIGATKRKVWESLRNQKPTPPMCCLHMDFCGVLPQYCGCPEQCWATSMAVGHQARFLSLNNGDSWSLVNPIAHCCCASIYTVCDISEVIPPSFLPFPTPLAKKWPPSAFLSQGRDASQMLITLITVISRQPVLCRAPWSGQGRTSMLYQ